MFCGIMSTAVFYILSNASQYLTMYRPLVPCHFVHSGLLQSVTVCWYVTLRRTFVLCHSVYCCLLQSVHCLSVPNTVPSVSSVPLCTLQSSTFCPLSASTLHRTTSRFCVTMSSAVFYSSPLFVGTLHSTVACFCVTLSTALFYSSSTVCQYLTLNLMLVMCHCVPSCLL